MTLKTWGVLLLAPVLIFGCSSGDDDFRTLDENDNVQNTDPPEAHAHHHEAGPHGGHILEFGAYHGEITLADGIVTVYLLGDDAKTAVALENATATLVIESKENAVEVALAASPEEGEAAGSTSRFVSEAGAVPAEIDDIEKLHGHVKLTVGEETLTGEVSHDHDHGHDHDH